MAQRFGALIHSLATRAGYDLTPGAGGRLELAKRSGMHKSSVGRMLDGQTLPNPSNFAGLARALDVDVLDLMVEGEILTEEDRRKSTGTDVRSATSQTHPLTPEAAADAWGIKNPIIRGMLLSNINEAIRLQHEADRPGTASSGGP